MRKRLLQWVFALAVLLPCLLITASAASGSVTASGYCGTNLTWTLYEDGELVISGTGAMGYYSDSSSVPWNSYRSQITKATIGDRVTSIGGRAFGWCKRLTSVTIPGSVTTIGDSAFVYCTGLTSVVIPDRVTDIGDSVFNGCTGLTSVVIPDRVTDIGYHTFYGCTGLTSVTIGDSVTSIDERAFYGCTSLTSVTIGDSVTSIGYDAFADCPNLKSVYYTGDVANWCGIQFDSCAANPNSSAGNLFVGGEPLTGALVIPNGVPGIGDYAFYGCTGLTAVSVPNSVTHIGDWAFSGCTGLTSVTIPNSVTSIDNGVFSHCTGLTSVTIPDSVTVINPSVFKDCTSLTSMTVPDSVTHIYDYAFSGCTGLTSVTIPNSVTYIWESAFQRCTGLTRMEFLGNAPTPLPLKSGDLFNQSDNLTIYYHEGTTGWTDSEYYDAEAGTWCGRPLVMIYDVENYKPAGKHPEKEDHIFAGWYDDDDHKKPHKDHGGNAHAKFVHKDVFRVKGQISTNTTPQSEFADIRFLTSVDCLNYKRIGFKITFGGKTVTQEFSTVYSSIVSNTEGLAVEVTPDQAFHADSQYFVTMVLKEIPNKHFDDVFTVTPYWVTQDGTVVEGVTNELRVSDGF